jgi:reticulon-4-interacting protein 1, mitochondrial
VFQRDVVEGGKGSPSSRRVASTAAAEKTCRAVVVPRFGGPEVMEIRQGVPVPDLKPREVLVRARAVSINPLDLRVSPPLWTHATPM